MTAYRKDNHFYIGNFDDELPEIFPKFIKETHKQAGIEGGHLDLYINSYGGWSHDCHTMINLIEVAKAHGVVVRTMVTGVAYSSGSLVAVAGSIGERYMARTATHLIHFGQTWDWTTGPVEQERVNLQAKRFFKQTREHYLKYTDIPEDELDKGLAVDSWFLDYAKCKRWSICDEPLDKFYLAE